MKKRWIITAALALVLIAAVAVVAVRERPVFNVFDLLIREVKAAEAGRDTVILTESEGAYADYDFGWFECVQVPEADMCLRLEGRELILMFFNTPEDGKWNTSLSRLFRYDPKERVLYGETSLEYLTDGFLEYYFSLCESAGAEISYSVDDLGEFDFVRR